MTPAQAKKVFGRTTVPVSIEGSHDVYWWAADFKIGRNDNAVIACLEHDMTLTTAAAARRHAREFFKKLGLKVRFGK